MSGSAGQWRRCSGIDSIPPPTLTHIGAAAFIDRLTVEQWRPCDQRGTRAGTVNLNVVPLRSLEATQIRPPNDRSTTRRQRYRPSPSPPCERLRPAGPVFSQSGSPLAAGAPPPRPATVIPAPPPPPAHPPPPP